MPDNLLKLGVFELVDTDLFQVANNTYVVLVDKKTGFRVCHHLKHTTTEDVIEVLERWFHPYGFPSHLRSDIGPQFRLRFTAWCGRMGIKHETSSCYNPESNGLSERTVGVIKQMLKNTGPVKGGELEKLTFSLNAMSR